MTDWYVEVVINPVQEFIAKVRKTRDLWSGSFLLSYLSASMVSEFYSWKKGHSGMATLQTPYTGQKDWNKSAIDILIDLVERRSEGTRKDGSSNLGDQQLFGSLPHFLKIKVDTDAGARDIAIRLQKTFENTWKEIADGVWNLLPSSSGLSKNIWDRQVSSYWNLSIIISQQMGSDKYGKLNRLFLPPAEDWIGCTMFGDLQDLTGDFRWSSRKAKWENFVGEWKSGISNNNHTMVSDFDEGEWLSALGVVKRLFPVYLCQKFSKTGYSDLLNGIIHFKSVTYYAALPWLKWMDSKKNEFEKEIEEFVELVSAQTAQEGKSIGLEDLPSDAFFEDSIKNLPFKEGTDEETQNQIRKKLQKLTKTKKPEPYYSILIMDGDRLGRYFSEVSGSSSGKTEASRRLSEFATTVPKTVAKHNGVLIYAGGDDVLAILPSTQVLKCASDIRKDYTNTLGADIDPKNGYIPTISAGIVFSHHKLPLRVALKEAHHLLEQVAKDENGRDSFAVSVLFPSTTKCGWISPWIVEGKAKDNIQRFNELLEKLSCLEFSNSFFYKAIDLFEKFDPEGNEDIVVEILTAEYFSTRRDPNTDVHKFRDKVVEACKNLLDMTFRWKNTEGEQERFGYDRNFIRWLRFYKERVMQFEDA